MHLAPAAIRRVSIILGQLHLRSGKGPRYRINYEICVLQTLREGLSSKEIWVVGAERFLNPSLTA